MSKVLQDGAQRAATHAETWDRMRPYWGAAGITRAGLITGLDRIGIPVAQSVRPDALGLAVDSGKGATDMAALCSAVMEGFERCVAERWVPENPVRMRQVPELCEGRFPVVAGSEDLPGEREWTFARGITSGRSWLVPADVVRMVAKRKFGARYVVGSNGASSGNNYHEAVAGGLYEVIERDAVHQAYASRERFPARVESVACPVVRSLISRIEDAGCAALLMDVTSDTGVPVYVGTIFDLQDPFACMCRGYGAHLDPHVAMARALCEAAQSRAVYIAGSRDDVGHEHFSTVHSVDGRGERARLLANCEAVVDWRKDMSTDTFEGDVAVLCDAMAAAGLPEPLVMEYKHEFPCSVVRVMAPTLAGYHGKETREGRPCGNAKCEMGNAE